MQGSQIGLTIKLILLYHLLARFSSALQHVQISSPLSARRCLGGAESVSHPVYALLGYTTLVLIGPGMNNTTVRLTRNGRLSLGGEWSKHLLEAMEVWQEWGTCTPSHADECIIHMQSDALDRVQRCEPRSCLKRSSRRRAHSLSLSSSREVVYDSSTLTLLSVRNL